MTKVQNFVFAGSVWRSCAGGSYGRIAVERIGHLRHWRTTLKQLNACSLET